jgi:hypothetical protein
VAREQPEVGEGPSVAFPWWCGEEAVSGECVALWSYRDRSRVVVADVAGNVVGSYPVPCESDRPGPEMLWDTVWCEYPGSEWEEEPEGQWSVPVFSQERHAEGR